MPPSAKLILVFGRTIVPSPWDILIPDLSLWESSRLNRGPPASGSLGQPVSTLYQIAGLVLTSPGLWTHYQRVSTPMVPAQGQHSRLPAALCPAWCWPLRTKIYNRVPAIKESQRAERQLPTHRCPAYGADFGKLATYSKAQRQEGRPSGEKGSELGLRVSKGRGAERASSAEGRTKGRKRRKGNV